MIFYIHCVLMNCGLVSTHMIIALYLGEYTKANQSEIGLLMMAFTFSGLLIKPLFCSIADRHQAYKLSLIVALCVELVGYLPFAIIPLFPGFYNHHTQCTWWILAVACQVGNGGLSVGWCLGDCLAMNYARGESSSYGRMRVLGGLAWAVYGFTLGQINETPALPKYLATYLMLFASLIFEIGLLIFWPNKDFIMIDPLVNRSSVSVNGQHQLEIGDRSSELKSNKSQLCADEQTLSRRKNPQVTLLKMIFREDGRLIKYVCLFAVFGMVVAPVNFLFTMMRGLCQDGACNFSELTSAVIISLAISETLSFLLIPILRRHLSRSHAIAITLLLMAGRALFYSGWYFDGQMSPYSAVVVEWIFSISYAMYCTLMAEVALMFANQSRVFIPELRRLGYLSQVAADTPRELVEAEEMSIKVALRATMQAIFDGFMSGLGLGCGSFISGLLIDLFDVVRFWQFFSVLCTLTVVVHQLVELTKSSYSDSYRPLTNTKAYEIRQLAGK